MGTSGFARGGATKNGLTKKENSKMNRNFDSFYWISLWRKCFSLLSNYIRMYC